MTPARTQCPSCRHRISPLALECPVCGLELARQALPRPLLFQASALHAKPVQEPRRTVVSSPALGRVAPVSLPEPESVPAAPPAGLEPPGPEAPLASEEAMGESFWPLARLEITEAGILLGFNAVIALLAAWLMSASPSRVYGELWHFLVPVHIAISWAFAMVPLTLAGQTPVMGSLGLLLDSSQPERRIAFSLFHLISVALFPLSFLCMVLTPYHRTLAELLTGQEILSRPLPRMR